ncbi:MAG: PAS domain-containing protein [Pseudomonadota bacterium]
MNDPVLTHLKAYWDHLRGRRQVPYRAELDPRKFEDALENMFILESLGPVNVRIRLAGTRLCELRGMELRGMVPHGFFAETDRERFDYALNAVLSGPSIAHFSLSGQDADGREMEAELLLLPLRSDFGDVTRILGCFSRCDELQAAPTRFAIAKQRIEPLSASGAFEPAESEAAGALAEDAAAFAGPERGPQLRAIEGAKTGTEDRAGRSRAHLSIVKDSS